MESKKVKSVCPYCGVGCGIVMEVAENRVVKVTGDREHPANFGRLCTKGGTSALALTESGRMEHAYFRSGKNEGPVRMKMDQALRETANRLRSILDEYGPESVSFYLSGQMSLEAQYLANKLAKGFIRTPHVESNSRLCMAGAGNGYKLSLGADGPPGSYEDIDEADLFFVIGANMADCHPILFLRLMDRVKKGAKLIVVDPRRTATAEKANLFMQIRPGTDLALLNGLLHLLVKNGRTDPGFIARYTSGFEQMPEFLEDYPPDKVAELTGIPEANIRKTAEWIGVTPKWMTLWTMGLNQSTHGTWHTNAICNLHLATGTICRPGSGPFSLTGQPNAMGGREMGYMGPGLPGQRTLLDEADRKFTEELWHLPLGTLRSDASGGAVSMFENIKSGAIKACWIICTNPVATVPNRKTVTAALETAELVIAQDAFLETETNKFADILLPAALWAEGEGVMVNSERNLTLMQKAVDPPGEALPDWQIIARVACEMGYASDFTYASSAEIFREIQQAWNPKTDYDLRGATYERLREAPVQWPCGPDEAAARRNPIRYLKKSDAGGDLEIGFPTPDGKAVFWARPYLPPAEMPDGDYPFVLNTGRLQHQWHTLTKTGKIPKLVKLNPGPFIEIHPEDANVLGIQEKDSVELVSRRGKAVLPAVITDRVRPGNCFAPFHWNDLFGSLLAVNDVTNDAVDPLSLQPELKFCSVSLTKVYDQTSEMQRASVSSSVSLSSPPGAAVPKTTESLSPNGDHSVTILWASQTGNAEGAALYCAQKLKEAGHRIKLAEMEQYPAAALSAERRVLFVVSTFGSGDPPDNGESFFRELNRKEIPFLTELEYAVLAFGDSSYEMFCGFGQNLDVRLAELGAKRLLDCTRCDTEYREIVEVWTASIAERLILVKGNPRPPVSTEQSVKTMTSTGSDATFSEEPESSTMAKPLGYHRNRPVIAKLRLHRLLNLNGSEKETRHYAFDLAGTGLEYEAGDALGVWPNNCPDLVAELLDSLKLDASAIITVKGLGQMPLADALRNRFEITRITRDNLRFIQERSGSETLKQLLQDDRQEALREWRWGRQFIDVLQEFPVNMTPQELIDLLKPLQPRLYSIASGPKSNPDEVHITVSTVRYDFRGRLRKGVCSTFLADLAKPESEIPVFIQKNHHFRLPPAPDEAMIMVGSGTGIAPFRGFLQERRAGSAAGKNWLIFGEQREKCDFYFKDELEKFRQEGFLHRLDTAFSRDQTEKVYVQQRILENGAEIWAWLQEGAYFYVCGNAAQMAKEVESALQSVIAEHGRMNAEAAKSYLKEMSRGKRYAKDVY